MSAQGMGCAFIGLQHMDSNSQAVRSLLRSLAGIVLHSCSLTPLDSQAVANILASLKHFSSDIEEVRLVLNALVVSIQRHPSTLSGAKSKEMSMSLWGLQSMATDTLEVEQLLEIITVAIEAPDSSFRRARPEEVLYAIGGLRRMTSVSGAVQRLLSALAACAVQSLDASEGTTVVRTDGSWRDVSEVAVGAALFGLQGMHDSNKGTLDVVAAISRIINTCHVKVSERVLGSLYGIE
jgi:hypothetical protein